MGRFSVSFRDYSGETSTATLDFEDAVDGAGYDLVMAAMTPALVNLEALSDGAQLRQSLTAFAVDVNNPLPTDPRAQRELKWYIPLVHLDGRRKSFTIPVARLVGTGGLSLLVPGTDRADMTRAEWAAFATWLAGDNVFFPGFALDGTPYLVGRNI